MPKKEAYKSRETSEHAQHKLKIPGICKIHWILPNLGFKAPQDGQNCLCYITISI